MCEMENCQAVKDIEIIKKSVDDIKVALLGNDFNNNQGLIYTIADHERRISKLERKWIYITGISTTIGVIAGALIQILF